MKADLTPEIEKLIEERVKAKEKEMIKGFDDFMFNKLGKIIRAMKERFGEEAYGVIVETNREEVKQQWRKKAEDHGDSSIESLIKLLWEPLNEHNGFGYTMEKTDEGVQMTCTRCPGAEIAQRLGCGKELYHEFCKNDWSIVEGFNPNIGFTMTKTLMQGDDCCNHFYYYKDGTGES
ncbi:MAG: L-2-amino-thiazoline-4-carboxylic acid hydrolase [Defluviitaleaceae bacterium]|nr:L-2-amino-thiazoline-4-carboxylic acid hydrolase [Defluviitaleaceae bacterium]